MALWLSILQAILVPYVRVDDVWVKKVREAAARGSLVFVLRNRSLIDFLCLRGVCKKYGLPEVSFVTGLLPFFYMPLWRFLIQLLRPMTAQARLQRLTNVLATGSSAVIFLRQPAARGVSGSQPVAVDGIRIATQAQLAIDEPVLALPTVFLWGEQAMSRFPGTMDLVFGSNEYPRLLRSVWLLLRRRSIHELLVGEPLDLTALGRERGVSDDVLPGVVRAGVGRQIEKIRRSRLGFLTKPSSRIKKEVLGSPRLLRQLAAIAKEEDMSEKEIPAKAHAIVKKMATDFRPRVLAVVSIVVLFIWKRIYTGIEVSEEDTEKMRAALANGPSLILPTHKSHVDYLVISHLMHTHNTMLPHIAAGQNLSFWPLGWIFRSSGAFFIRRRFLHDRFYTAIVNAYLRRLLQERYAIEIFIEGGRSRSGKLLRPKIGMLEMALKVLSVTPQMDIQILPVFIGYERVIEEGEYTKESTGGSKRAESIKGLLKTTKVLLSRYGRLYVRIGNPFSTKDVLNSLNLTLADLDDGSTRREVAFETALRNYKEINRISITTPSAVIATILLTNRNRDISHDELRKLSLWLVDFLDNSGAPLTSIVSRWKEKKTGLLGQPRGDLLDRTIRAFVKGGRIHLPNKSEHQSYTLLDGQRLPLNYYKNNIIHFLIPASLVSTACLLDGDKGVNMSRVVEYAAMACRLFRWEFMLPYNPSYDEERCRKEAAGYISDALELLVQDNIITRKGEDLVLANREKALLFSDVLLGFYEIYYAALLATKEKALSNANGDTSKRVQEIAEKFVAQGRFIHPEIHTRSNIKSAIQIYKEMRIIRPQKGEKPFDEGQQGDCLVTYLEEAISTEQQN